MDAPVARTLMTGWLLKADPGLSRDLLNAGRMRQFGDGVQVHGFHQEQLCMWGVVSGTVRLFVAMNEQEPMLAHCAGPGFWFGEAPVITGQPRAMQAVTFGDAKLCAIDRSAVVALARKNPDAWQAVATLSVMNELMAIGAAEDLMIRNSAKRLVAVLLRLAGHRNAFQGAPPLVRVPVTQTELSDACALSRSSATRILRDLAARGMIRTDYRSVVICDGAALASLLAA